MPRIVGLDVSRGDVAVCILSEKPDRPREWFQKHRLSIPTLDSNQKGIKALLEMKPDIAILEPTGVHYSKFWADHLHGAGVEIRWVGHAQLKSYRLTLRLPSKNDEADALALACYGIEHLEDSKFFLQFDLYSLAHELRQTCLQIRHLERLTVPLKNRLRQNLAHEWPEVAQQKTNGCLWKFIAGEPTSKIAQTKLTKSLASTAGRGLSDFTRFEASQLCRYEDQIEVNQAILCEIASLPEFHRYHAVFAMFGFGPRIGAMILSHIYPLDNFLGPDGKEIIDIVKSKNGKRSKRYRSLNAFKLALGFGLIEDSSGKSDRWIPGGSSLVRSALWQWVFTRIEVKRCRPRSKVGVEIAAICDRLKANGLPAKLVRSRVAGKAVEKLFYALLDAL